MPDGGNPMEPADGGHVPLWRDALDLARLIGEVVVLAFGLVFLALVLA